MADQAAARPAEQVDHERAMGEVSDVLLNVEHALTRARKAHKTVTKLGNEPNCELALAVAVSPTCSGQPTLSSR